MAGYKTDWIGRHEGFLRDVARGCGYGDPVAIEQGATLLAARLNGLNFCLVPMPSHIGYATTMKTLCEKIVEITNKVKGIVEGGMSVCDCLQCNPHESSHIVKLQHGVPPTISMSLKGERPDRRRQPVIIDNTIATGATAGAALEVLPDAIVLAITKG